VSEGTLRSWLRREGDRERREDGALTGFGTFRVEARLCLAGRNAARTRVYPVAIAGRVTLFASFTRRHIYSKISITMMSFFIENFRMCAISTAFF